MYVTVDACELVGVYDGWLEFMFMTVWLISGCRGMTPIHPPTAHLPPIAKIVAYTSAQLLDALLYLRLLYNPEVRGSRRIRAREVRPTKSHWSDDSDAIQLIRSDTFERSYAVRWLIALISRMEDIQEPTPDTQACSASALEQPVHPEVLIQHAAALLAVCAGVAAAGTVQRIFSFESDEAGRIEIPLKDIPLENHDYTSVGGQTWGGACVLAEMIVEHLARFGLGDTSPVGNDDRLCRGDLRILELGAGTGLVGLTVAKLLAALGNRWATVVSTDFHPSILANLKANIDANFPARNNDGMITIVSHFLDWANFPVSASIPDVLSEPFDIVLGADIIYEVEHATWIKNCLKRLLRYPSDSQTTSLFHLVIPLRSTHAFESSTIESVFQWENHAEPVILSKESIFCEAHGDIGNDVVEYVYYRIGFPESQPYHV